MAMDYFRLYPGQYLTDPKVCRLTLAQQGIAVRLWCLFWLHGPLPGDLEELRRLLPSDAKVSDIRIVTNSMWCVNSDDTNTLVSPRMDAERSGAVSAYEARRNAAEATNAARKLAAGNDIGTLPPSDGDRPANRGGNRDSDRNGHGKVGRKVGRSKSRGVRGENDVSDFEAAWSAYPRRPGNSRANALRSWNARLAEGVSPSAMIAGAQAYAAHCAREQTPPRFVKLAATFFGPGRHWEADYGPMPAAQVQVYDERGELTAEAARAVGLIR